jgi:hypothetical protein
VGEGFVRVFNLGISITVEEQLSSAPSPHTLLTEGKEAIRQKFGLPHSKIRWVSKDLLTLVST